jgi:hypothetical protein
MGARERLITLLLGRVGWASFNRCRLACCPDPGQGQPAPPEVAHTREDECGFEIIVPAPLKELPSGIRFMLAGAHPN